MIGEPFELLKTRTHRRADSIDKRPIIRIHDNASRYRIHPTESRPNKHSAKRSASVLIAQRPQPTRPTIKPTIKATIKLIRGQFETRHGENLTRERPEEPKD
jgi:hypothetical protein